MKREQVGESPGQLRHERVGTDGIEAEKSDALQRCAPGRECVERLLPVIRWQCQRCRLDRTPGDKLCDGVWVHMGVAKRLQSREGIRRETRHRVLEQPVEGELLDERLGREEIDELLVIIDRRLELMKLEGAARETPGEFVVVVERGELYVEFAQVGRRAQGAMDKAYKVW